MSGTYDIASLVNILKKRYDREITDATTKRGPGNFDAGSIGLYKPQTLMDFLRANGRILIGENLDAGAKTWPVRSAGGSASSYTAKQAIPSGTKSTYVQAEMDWSRTRNILEFDNLALEDATGDKVVGDEDAILLEYKEKLQELFSDLEDQLVGSGTGNDMDGFQSFMSASNTYAGINQSTASYWQATTVAGGSADPTFAKMDEVLRDMDAKGVYPTHILMGMTQHHKYCSLFNDGMNFTGNDATSHTAPPYKGIPIIPINTMNNASRAWDEMWFININDLYLEFNAFRGAAPLGINANAQSYFGVPVGLDHEPTGKDKRLIVQKCYHRFYAKNPKKHAVLHTLKTSF